MSERRYKAHWVQNILHNQKIKFSLNNIISEGNARIISKDKAPELASEVQKLMKTKYDCLVLTSAFFHSIIELAL